MKPDRLKEFRENALGPICTAQQCMPYQSQAKEELVNRYISLRALAIIIVLLANMAAAKPRHHSV
jgi:hypothetical protein